MLGKCLATLTFSVALASGASAAFPERPIRIVVPAAAGGGSDTLARLIAPKLTELLGQPVVVENRAGASGTIGAIYVSQQSPDGHTLLLTSPQHASTASLMRNLPYDPVKDFAHVIGLVMSPMVLQVKADSPIKSVSDLIAAAKAKPGSVTYGSAGNGNVSQLLGIELSKQSGAPMTHIPYKGAGEAIADLLGGHITFAFNNAISTAELQRSGKLRALAVSVSPRLDSMPNVPAMSEVGFPSFNLGAWFGLVAPGKTPKEAVDKLNAAINSIMESPEIKERFAVMGVQPIGGAPEAFEKIVVRDVETWRRLVEEGVLKPE